MKKILSFSMAVVMTFVSFSTVTMAASVNDLSEKIDDMGAGEILIDNVEKRSLDFVTSGTSVVEASVNNLSGKIDDMGVGEILIDNVEERSLDFVASGTPVYLQITPKYEVEIGSSIILNVENGKFDEDLCTLDPFIYRSPDGSTYEDLYKLAEAFGGTLSNYNTIAREYVKNAQSRQMPYGFRYINSEQIEVYLWPISYSNANSPSSRVSNGVPYYNIALPITTEGSSEGDVTVSIDSNNSNISSGTYTIANVVINDDSDGDSTTEPSTETITETESEDTTNVTETTTETVSEDTTNVTETTTETVSENTTENTTQSATENSTETTTKTTTESVTETTTEAATETTTRKTTSSGGGGGAGASSLTVNGYTSTTTTEATTETTTEEDVADTEDDAEETTEETVNTVSTGVRVTIGSTTVIVNGESYEMDAAPYIQSASNSTLVPLRFVAIAIAGGNVESADNSSNIAWDASTKTAVITFDGKTIEFTAGSNVMVIDGTAQAMDNGVQAEITDGRMFVPFRALGEALGVSVEWDADTKTAIYN